jgi:hypothetical protein
MNGKPTTYIINFFAEGVNLWALTQYLHENKEIIAYWNYIPLVFCVKTYLSSQDLTERLQPYFPHPFMIAEINENNINGRLPQEAWQWFYMEHHQKQVFPSLAGLGWPSLGGLGGLGGLLPKK